MPSLTDSARAMRLVLFSLVCASLGCTGGGKYDSPEACFKTLQIAGHNKDMPGLCACLTEESQETLAGMLVMAGGMLKMQTGGAAVAATMEKHGVTDEVLQAQAANFAALVGPDGLRDLSKIVKDKVAFIADMFTAMQGVQQGADFSAQFEQQIAGELKDVKIDGDQATAFVVTAKGEDPLEFRKTAAGWKLHITPGPGATPPPA